MYLNALEFLEEEREVWRPFEALDALSDEQLDRPVAGAHGWTARDLIGHLVAWQEMALQVAKELAVGERSATKERLDREWDERGGEAINAAIEAEWRATPLDEVRRRMHEVPGELRGYLTVVPEMRWLKHTDNLRYFLDETLDHYSEHAPDLAAVLGEASR